MDNIWKRCGLKLKDILIQKEFIGKDKLLYRTGKGHSFKGHLLVDNSGQSKLYITLISVFYRNYY